MEARTEPVPRLLRYPVVDTRDPQMWQGIREIGNPDRADGILTPSKNSDAPSGSESSGGAIDEHHSEDAVRSFEAGREQGIREGRDLERQEHRAAMAEYEKERIGKAAELARQFSEERDRFFEAAESEVARLALAISSRILRREAQIDPLFLIGAVRVALGQLTETAKVQLHVPEAEAELWRETLAHVPNLKLQPTVVAEEHLRRGDCVLESDLGSADLGVNAQLGEVSRYLYSSPGAGAPEPESLDRRKWRAQP